MFITYGAPITVGQINITEHVVKISNETESHMVFKYFKLEM